MLFTKTEALILELFVSKPLTSFTIREVSRIIGKDVKIVHTAMTKLIQKNFFLKDKHQHLKLNYKLNQLDLVNIEALRKEKFFQKNISVKIALNDFLKKTKFSFFILLIFGSYAQGNQRKDSDLDILAILPEKDELETFERELTANLSISPLKVHPIIINQDDFRNMFQKREEFNVANECLEKHILIFGGENYYKLFGERDVR